MQFGLLDATCKQAAPPTSLLNHGPFRRPELTTERFVQPSEELEEERPRYEAVLTVACSERLEQSPRLGPRHVHYEDFNVAFLGHDAVFDESKSKLFCRIWGFRATGR